MFCFITLRGIFFLFDNLTLERTDVSFLFLFKQGRVGMVYVMIDGLFFRIKVSLVSQSQKCVKQNKKSHENKNVINKNRT